MASRLGSGDGGALVILGFSDDAGGRLLRFRDTDSSVGRGVSSVGFWGGGIETWGQSQSRRISTFALNGERTRWLFGEEFASIVVVYRPYGQTPSCCAALPAAGLLCWWRGGEETACLRCADGK